MYIARPRGKLHEDTYYGIVTLQNGKTAFAVRKPLESLAPAMVERIIDGGTRRAIIKRLRAYGIDRETKPSKPSKEAFKEPLCLPGTQTPIN